MFESQKITASKVLNGLTSSTSGMSLTQFQAMLSSSVLQELDAQIGMFKSEIEAAGEEKKALRKDITDINAKIAKAESCTIPASSDKPEETSKFVYLNKDEYELLVSYSKDLNLKTNLEGAVKNSETIHKLKKLKDKGDKYISADFFETFKETLENRLTDLNSQTETDGIHFQALMDSRKQNLLMLSNMLSSDHQIKMSIINNMKS